MRAAASEVRLPEPARAAAAAGALALAARLWFVCAVLGQWAFLYYIAAFYDAATLRGDFPAWSRNPYLLRGYIAGDTAGNLQFAAHVLLAAAVTCSGALQLVPLIRARWPAVHRWNGRLFATAAIAAALSGLAMIWLRGARANLTAGLATSLDAVLILACALFAWRAALRRDFDAHRRWALRTWIVANGVWFQRIGIFGWTAFHQAPLGMTRHFDGWFDLSWAFACYLLPLALLEGYLRVSAHGSARARYAFAAMLAVCAIATACAGHAAYSQVWRPFLWKLG